MTPPLRARPRRSGRPRPTAGFTLIEILFATVVLAFSMIPIFGIMTSGMMRTDTNVGYSNGVEVATAVMNELLSEQTPLLNIPSTSGTATYPPRGSLTPEAGSVAADTMLDPIFPASAGWSTSTSGTRVIKRNNIEYHVQLWVGLYGAATDLQFGYFEDPVIDWSCAGGDFSGGNHFHKVNTIDATEYTAGYSPYHATADANPCSAAGSRILTHAWGQDEVILDQSRLTTLASGAYRNFAKLVVRVSWGYEGKRERGRAKDFWLVSFKADLKE